MFLKERGRGDGRWGGGGLCVHVCESVSIVMGMDAPHSLLAPSPLEYRGWPLSCGQTVCIRMCVRVCVCVWTEGGCRDAF